MSIFCCIHESIGYMVYGVLTYYQYPRHRIEKKKLLSVIHIRTIIMNIYLELKITYAPRNYHNNLLCGATHASAKTACFPE